jgi:hypothetical protein
MAGRRFGRASWIGVLPALLLGATSPAASCDPLSDLEQAFHDAYSNAAGRTLETLRASAPVLVNNAGQIALYRPGVPEPDIFTMDSRLFLEASTVAHTPVALEARLVPDGLGRLDPGRLDWLAKYENSLAKADDDIAHRTDLPAELQSAQRDILTKVRRTAGQARRTGQIARHDIDDLGAAIRQDIRFSLKVAATAQLDQFRKQIETWKAAYPDLAWDKAVVVIVAGHQPRRDQLQQQFFDWMLHDDPGRQEHVVYAETLDHPPPLDRKPATEAMVLLSKVMLDKSLAASIFGDPLALQSDALGPAAGEIIGSWEGN